MNMNAPAAIAATATPAPMMSPILLLPSEPVGAPESPCEDWKGSTLTPMLRSRAGMLLLRATASAIAPSSTAPVLRLSTGIGSTAKTFEPLTAAPTAFSCSAALKTNTTACGACEWARSISPRTSLTSRVSTTNTCPRLALERYSRAAAIESTGRTEACPPKASPSSNRKSSRVVIAVTSTDGRVLEPEPVPAKLPAELFVSVAREAFDALATECLHHMKAAGTAHAKPKEHEQHTELSAVRKLPLQHVVCC